MRSPEPIETKEMWDQVVLRHDGHIDGQGMVVGDWVLGLNDDTIVEAGEDGNLRGLLRVGRV